MTFSLNQRIFWAGRVSKMPEQDKEKRTLEGKVVETTSSDTFVARQVESIRQQIGGTTGRIINVTDVSETDVFAPKSLTGKVNVAFSVESSADTQVFAPDSPIQITEVRTQLAVARATDDLEAFEAIKRAA